MRQELRKHEKEKQKQASTSNDQLRKPKTSGKHTIKIGKGKDKVLVQSCSKENIATCIEADTTDSMVSEKSSSQKGKGSWD